MNKKSRLIILSILGVLIALCLAIGFSKAFLAPVLSSDDSTKINLNNCAKIVFKETGSAISLGNTAPMDDEVALEKVTPYEFSVSSTCEDGTTFGIYLGLLSTNTLNKDNIKYAIKLKNSSSFLVKGSLKDKTNTKTSLSTEEIGQLETSLKGTVSEVLNITDEAVSFNRNLDFELYLWVDSTVNDLNTAGKSFTAGVFIKSDSPYQINLEPFVTLADYIKNSYTGQGNDDLYYHDQSLANGANDKSYRFAGDSPHNFVCFGAGSENYNSGKDPTCPDGNQYRIIGIFNNSAKLVKSEYLTMADINNQITSVGTSEFKPENVPSPHVQNTKAPGFFKTGTRGLTSNVWSDSDLYKKLNDESNGYLYKLGTDWTNKIILVTWNIGTANIQGYTPKVGFDVEITGSNGDVTVSAKVGLLYVTEYAYAATPANWTKSFYKESGNDYRDKSNQDNNWLFNGIIEWLISKNSTTNGSFRINSNGGVYNGIAASGAYAIRPTFSLASETKLRGGNGTYTTPYQISIK